MAIGQGIGVEIIRESDVKMGAAGIEGDHAYISVPNLFLSASQKLWSKATVRQDF